MPAIPAGMTKISIFFFCERAQNMNQVVVTLVFLSKFAALSR